MKWYRQFWENLVPVLGFELGTLWSATKEANPVLDCRRSTVAWLWRRPWAWRLATRPRPVPYWPASAARSCCSWHCCWC
jgi:hypothetical protein